MSVKYFSDTVKRMMADIDGATAIEYGLIASLIAIAIISGATLLGSQLASSFDYIKNQVKTS